MPRVNARVRHLLAVSHRETKDDVATSTTTTTTTDGDGSTNVGLPSTGTAMDSFDAESALWKPLCRRLWPWLPQQPLDQWIIVSGFPSVDDDRITEAEPSPLSGSTTASTTGIASKSPYTSPFTGQTMSRWQVRSAPPPPPSYANLLPLATAWGSTSMSQIVEQDALETAGNNPSNDDAMEQRRPVLRQSRMQHREHQQPLFVRSNSDASVWQFTGTVGIGNQCLTSNSPLPRPTTASTTPTLRIPNPPRIGCRGSRQ